MFWMLIFTAFFSAWSNYLKTGKEIVITGFTPRVVMLEQSRRLFFEDYPDGKMICVIRDPESWYASTSRHNKYHRELDFALDEWILSVNSALTVFKEYGADKALLLSYSSLLTEPMAQMKRVSEFVGIDYSDILINPTFLGQPLRPNSSYAVDTIGINPKMLDHKERLETKTREIIKGKTAEVYSEAIEISTQN